MIWAFSCVLLLSSCFLVIDPPLVPILKRNSNGLRYRVWHSAAGFIIDAFFLLSYLQGELLLHVLYYNVHAVSCLASRACH
jgi:hypothetical protein